MIIIIFIENNNIIISFLGVYCIYTDRDFMPMPDCMIVLERLSGFGSSGKTASFQKLKPDTRCPMTTIVTVLRVFASNFL